MTDAEQPIAWLKGALDLCLLGLLADGEAYGYELAGRLTALGLGPVAGGTLYPALLRLEKAGRLVAEWRVGERGPGRKYYRLTDEGQQALASEAASWRRFVIAVDRALAGADAR